MQNDNMKDRKIKKKRHSKEDAKNNKCEEQDWQTVAKNGTKVKRKHEVSAIERSVWSVAR